MMSRNVYCALDGARTITVNDNADDDDDVRETELNELAKLGKLTHSSRNGWTLVTHSEEGSDGRKKGRSRGRVSGSGGMSASVDSSRLTEGMRTMVDGMFIRLNRMTNRNDDRDEESDGRRGGGSRKRSPSRKERGSRKRRPSRKTAAMDPASQQQQQQQGGGQQRGGRMSMRAQSMPARQSVPLYLNPGYGVARPSVMQVAGPYGQMTAPMGIPIAVQNIRPQYQQLHSSGDR